MGFKRTAPAPLSESQVKAFEKPGNEKLIAQIRWLERELAMYRAAAQEEAAARREAFKQVAELKRQLASGTHPALNEAKH